MRKLISACRWWLAVLLVTLTACDSDMPANDEGNNSLADDLPASFSGQLPCADCPGIDMQLNLFADNSFYLKRDYQNGQPGEFYALGHWRQQRGTLQLISNDDVPQFLISSPNELHLLDQHGSVIKSDLNYQLSRDETFQQLYPTGQFTGMYRYVADSGLFEECQTGQTWPVAQREDNQRLQNLYLHYARQPNQALYTELVGKLTSTENPDTGKPLTTLVVKESFHIWPAESCGEPGFQEQLLGTRWYLTRIHDTPIETETFSEQPYISLSIDDDQFSGSDGCNQLMGRYRLNDNKLRFDKIASTRKACPVEPLSAQTLYIAMEQVRNWQIEQHQLILKNSDGETLLRFEAEED